MDVVQQRVRVERLAYAPSTCPCPHCGKTGRRKAVHTRRVRDIAYREIVVLEIEVGEYRACCSCCKTFRAHVEGIEPRAAYTNRVREAVIDLLLDDSMSMERLRQALQRDFHLELSDGFLYDCLDWKVRQAEMPADRQWTLDNFSGTLCLDDIHLGHCTLLLATDPINDFPVAFALVRANDPDHMRRFLGNLQHWGFAPQVVVTDGSNLYPTVLADIWPEARHQLCVFHVLKDINAHVFDALRRLRRRLAQQGKRQRRRGRLSKAQARARKRHGKTKKEQAYFIWKHRHLIVTRPENLSGRERHWLSQMFQSLPALRTLRRFVLAVYRLFDPDQSPHQARCRRAALVKTPEFLADADLAQALALLPPDKFDMMIACLHSPSAALARFDVSDQKAWEKADLQFTLTDPVASLRGQYDYVLFDCPPRLSLESFAALCASDAVILPMEAADWGAQGIMQVTDAIDYVRRHYNPRLRLLGYLVSRFKRARAYQQSYLRRLRAHFGPLAFDTVIPDLAQFEKSVTDRIPITLHAPRSEEAAIARALFTEVERRLEGNAVRGRAGSRPRVQQATTAAA